ncbi:hypothetical protein BGZ80_000473 [Entomortierella chlamydospora]|uniref:Uncharacterized protein n=1 Tax=Entomortierella chlamydospora TaxID=101097 RepID=A0A9P6T4R2_9FUNG|nr:hypothetical protein BGZ80_000473 [Entomortierella chlamydospora]
MFTTEKKESGRCEKTLLDDISIMFGPHIEDVSMTQDFYCMKRRQYSSAHLLPVPQQLVGQRLLSRPSGRDDLSAHYEVTAQAPLGDPQIHIGRWFHLHWLRELKIVYRATNEKPFFLHWPTSSNPSVSQPDSLQGSPMLAVTPRVIDFTPCVTLESLSIEDIDRNGRPQRLWRYRAHGMKDVIPFDKDQGIKLPSKLKSFEMIGQSADRFNFGLLGTTPRLECLQILGMKCRAESTASSLESLDIRDIPEDAFGVCCGGAHPQDTCSNRDIIAEFGNLTKSRIEVLRTPGSQSRVTVCGLSDVLQRYFSNVAQLYLDGISKSVVEEATNSQRMPRLRQGNSQDPCASGSNNELANPSLPAPSHHHHHNAIDDMLNTEVVEADDVAIAREEARSKGDFDNNNPDYGLYTTNTLSYPPSYDSGLGNRLRCHAKLMRARERDTKVTNVELFFDLVFVFAMGRSLAAVIALHGHRLQKNYIRILFWFVVSAVLWLVGGAVGGKTRNVLWIIAIIFEYMAPAAGFYTPGIGKSLTSDWDIHGGHLAERCSLFIIVALGESIVVTGDSFKTVFREAAGVGMFIVAFVGAAAMWWIYFHTASTEAIEYVEHCPDPGRIGRVGYTYIHVLMVIGIVWSAVADRISIVEPFMVPHEKDEMMPVVMMIGGPALFVLGHAMFRHTFCQRWPVAHLATIVALVCVTPIGIFLPAWATAIATTTILVLLGVYESYFRCYVLPNHINSVHIE